MDEDICKVFIVKQTVLVMGASGMLGHKMVQVLSKEFNVFGTTRVTSTDSNIIGGVRADNMESVRRAIKQCLPDVIVNCIGIIKQLPEANDPLTAISVNALFPHKLARVCKQNDIRLIHISSDCVFSGKKGYYTEIDQSDAEDLYGRSKYLGEVYYPGCLTIRTSIIGRELHSSNGLLEWFIKNKNGVVSGYANVRFSGLTTLELSCVVGKIIKSYFMLTGLYHVSSSSIDKNDLLHLINSEYKLNITINPEYDIKNNRSLDSSKFMHDTDIKIPSWKQMISDMHKDVI